MPSPPDQNAPRAADDPSSADEASVAPPPVVRTIVACGLAWLLFALVLLLVTGARPGVTPEGWRLTLLQWAPVASFLVILAVGAGAAIVHERRRRSP